MMHNAFAHLITNIYKRTANAVGLNKQIQFILKHCSVVGLVTAKQHSQINVQSNKVLLFETYSFCCGYLLQNEYLLNRRSKADLYAVDARHQTKEK